MLTVVRAPAAEVLTRDEAKRWARISNDHEDDVFDDLLPACRAHFERWTDRALITQTLEVETHYPRGREWNREPLYLPRAPLRAVVYAALLSEEDGPWRQANGAPIDDDDLAAEASGIELPTTAYRADVDGDGAGAFVPIRPGSWPDLPQTDATRREMRRIRIRYTAGHGDQASDVPPEIRHAIRRLLATQHEWRQDVVEETPSGLPDAIGLMVRHYRIGTRDTLG